MLKKLVSTGLLAASLMSMSGVVGASNTGNYQEDYYTAGYVNIKNLINGYQYGSIEYPQDPALTGTLDYSGYDTNGSNYQDLYGSNWVSTKNKIKGESNNYNEQINQNHIGALSLKNKISGTGNQANSMYANGYSDSEVKNNIVGYDNASNLQNVGWSNYYLDEYYYQDGVSTDAKAKNTIQSDYLVMPLLTLDGPVYPVAGNSGNHQDSWAEADADIENNIGRTWTHEYYDDVDGIGYEYTVVDGEGNSDNLQSVYTARTLANSKNKINGVANDLNGQSTDAWADQNVKNNIYGYYNVLNFQESGSDLSVKSKSEINGLGNSSNNQYADSWADQYLNNKIDGESNNNNYQGSFTGTTVSGKNKIDGVGNSANFQETDSSAYTDVSNKITGESNNGNSQYSDSYNNVKSSNSIESWDGVDILD